MRSYKGCYPWRVGATSYVIPADLLTNVRLLADKVDNVQLLFFESAVNSSLEHKVDIEGLARVAQQKDLTYTAHLPADLQLGGKEPDKRRQGVDEIVRLMGKLDSLPVNSFDLHLERNSELPVIQWLNYLDHSLSLLAEELGAAKKLVAVENIDYPYSQIEPFVKKYGFSRCLDLGHILHYQHDWSDAIGHVSSAKHIHYHGVQDNKDHRAITSSQENHSRELGAALAKSGYSGVVTLEIYDIDKLETSLASLEQAWAVFEKEKDAS